MLVLLDEELFDIEKAGRNSKLAVTIKLESLTYYFQKLFRKTS